jgi:hypothetical protein
MANLANTDKGAFEVFSKLPIELRLKIYRIAAPEPRIIELALGNNHALGRVLQRHGPPLLGTSREP